MHGTFKHGSKCSIRLVHPVHSLPYREGVQIFPFITLPQKIAPILPVGEQQRFCCVSGEIVMVPPGETQGVKAPFTLVLLFGAGLEKAVLAAVLPLQF